MKIIAYQLFRGLSYLHARNIVHCEIVPHSILLGSGCQVAIGEFRKSRFTKEIGSESVHEWTYLKEYRAPELILGAKNYLPSADIWSAGIILAELTTGHPPFIEDCDSEMIVEMTKILGRPSKE